MPELNNVNWRDFEKVLFFVGCQFLREEGDHRIYKKLGIKRPIVLPRQRPLSLGVLKNNLKTLGITTKQQVNHHNLEVEWWFFGVGIVRIGVAKVVEDGVFVLT